MAIFILTNILTIRGVPYQRNIQKSFKKKIICCGCGLAELCQLVIRIQFWSGHCSRNEPNRSVFPFYSSRPNYSDN